MEPLKSFNEWMLSESVESNTKEADLLAKKEELLNKKKEAVAAKNEKAKTQLERSIAMLDAEIDKIRTAEKEQDAVDEQI